MFLEKEGEEMSSLPLWQIDIISELERLSGVSSITRGNPPEFMTVNDWLSREKISDDDALTYPNARTAKEIKSSPLYEALL